MASPSAQPNGHTSPQPQPQQQSQQPQPQSSTEPSKPSATNATITAPPEAPLTSLSDDGTSKRPRDARLLHLVLSSQGINSYQERIPLQLLDFAYRYTSSVLSDSLRLAGEGYTGGGSDNNRGRGRAGGEDGSIGVTALRQAIASRQDFSFQGGGLPKEFMLQQAEERNRVGLPKVERGLGGGLALPEERYCLTGLGWGLKETWEESEDEEEEEDPKEEKMDGVVGGGEGDGEVEGEGQEDEEGAGRMEDVFGEEGAGDVDMGEG